MDSPNPRIPRLHATLLPAALLLLLILTPACGGGLTGPEVQTSDLPASDDFSGDCTWPGDSSGGASVGCVNGAYRILVKEPSVRGHQVVTKRFDAVNDVLLDADATLAALPDLGEHGYAHYGVGCWSSAAGKPGRGYVFVVKPDGEAGVLRFDETATELKPDFYLKTLAGAPANPAFAGTDSTLRIHAECDSNGPTTRLVMQVNGRDVVTTMDDAGFGPFQAAGFDVFTTASGTEVRYDNVELSEGRGATSDTSLPLADDFSSPCGWPSGTNGDIFSYGCADGAYRMTLSQTGPVNMTKSFGLHAPAVSGQISVAVASGRGTKPGNAILGIGCLKDDSDGYVAMMGTAGDHVEIWRLEPDGKLHLVGQAHGRYAVPALADPNRLRIVCAAAPDGSARIGLFVNESLVLTALDKDGLDEFNGFFLYANTYPGDVVFDEFAAKVPSQADIDAVQPA